MTKPKLSREIEEGVKTYWPVSEPVKLPFNVSKMRWLQRHGKKGSFELSDDLGNPDHQALLKFLVDYAGGCVNSEGFFYWVFPDGSVIGRKPLLKVSWKSQKSVRSEA